MAEDTTAEPAASIDELADAARSALAELAGRNETEAFQALLGMSAYVGECLSKNAQLLSAQMSWAQIADVAGTSRQNAWARWSS